MWPAAFQQLIEAQFNVNGFNLTNRYFYIILSSRFGSLCKLSVTLLISDLNRGNITLWVQELAAGGAQNQINFSILSNSEKEFPVPNMINLHEGISLSLCFSLSVYLSLSLCLSFSLSFCLCLSFCLSLHFCLSCLTIFFF